MQMCLCGRYPAMRRGECFDCASARRHREQRGTHRFGEMRRAIGGVSERMLAQTLQRLEGDGLVDRVARQTVPPHVEYSLTALRRQAAEKSQGRCWRIGSRSACPSSTRQGKGVDAEPRSLASVGMLLAARAERKYTNRRANESLLSVAPVNRER
ncbi:winged helix-turn-helix transcriptional regulator [Rhizobium laguerreae]|uniref:winged helix-turn-helix transcriptional regulator n=1 Tax=Rhizobium laguerreae TaxID=1076926 RepID=UPI003BA8455A